MFTIRIKGDGYGYVFMCKYVRDGVRNAFKREMEES